MLLYIVQIISEYIFRLGYIPLLPVQETLDLGCVSVVLFYHDCLMSLDDGVRVGVLEVVCMCYTNSECVSDLLNTYGNVWTNQSISGSFDTTNEPQQLVTDNTNMLSVNNHNIQQ